MMSKTRKHFSRQAPKDLGYYNKVPCSFANSYEAESDDETKGPKPRGRPQLEGYEMMTTTGERLATALMVFKYWSKTLFILDPDRREIRYYNLAKGLPTIEEDKPLGVYVFNPVDSKCPLEVKTVQGSFKRRSHVLRLSGGHFPTEATGKSRILILTFSDEETMTEWRRRINTIAKNFYVDKRRARLFF